MATPCLLVIDMQQAFVTHAEHWGPGGERNNPGAEERVRELLAAFRSRGMPVVHARHDSVEEGSPLWPGLPSHAFIAGCEPPDDGSEPVFGKAVNSAFIGTDLEAHLRANFLSDLVICGITSIHCVNTTVRMAGNLGFSVRVPEDATATFGRRNEEAEETTTTASSQVLAFFRRTDSDHDATDHPDHDDTDPQKTTTRWKLRIAGGPCQKRPPARCQRVQ